MDGRGKLEFLSCDEDNLNFGRYILSCDQRGDAVALP